MKTLSLYLTYFFIVIGLLFGILVFVEGEFKNIYPTIDFREAGPFGDYIGGVVGTLFSIAGIFLLFLNFHEQRKSFERERLETQFYERIKTYKEHLYELSFTRKKRVSYGIIGRLFSEKQFDSSTHLGRKVFKVIYYDFIALYKEADFLFANVDCNQIYDTEYLNWLKKNPSFIERKIDLIAFARIDMIYCILFTGLGSEERISLMSIFGKRYKKSFTMKLIAFASLKPVEHSTNYPFWEKMISSNSFKKIIFPKIYSYLSQRGNILAKENHLKLFNDIAEEYNLVIDDKTRNYYKYYGGHQFRLGHYFRHLFNSINFIDKNSSLGYKEKLEYILALRSQLSTYEQILFFLNSLSAYGRVWEYEDESERNYIKKNRHLITKYNLIRNISTISLAGEIDVSHYYPGVLFESRYKKPDRIARKKLERKYKFPILFKFSQY